MKTSEKTKDKLIQNITFFGDSSIPEGDSIYQSVWDTARLLAQNGFTIVNGGGPGIMKAATDGAESINGNTIAIYWEPKLASIFEGKNLSNITDESEAFANYITRTFGLIEKGDAFIVCKGGTGTVSEFGLVWALAKLYYGSHKPVILYGEFWDGIIESIQKGMYIDEVELSVLYQATTPEEVLERLIDHEEKIKLTLKTNITDSEESAFILGARVNVTKKSYNKNAADYHSERAGKLLAQEQLDEFIKLVNPPAHVLDIGCGPGNDMKYLSKKYVVEGVEISEKLSKIAQFDNPNSTVICGDIVTTEIGKNKYKGIWARDSIHHIEEENLEKVFKKIYDALVEDGIFYMIVREGEGEVIEKEKKSYGDLERFYNLFTIEKITLLAQKSGFSVMKMVENQRSHKWLCAILKK